MLTFLIAVLAGLLCGVLSGFGIGGGSLLMVWLTAAQSMEQRTAQGVNLLYFLPTAACSLFFHVKNKQIVWRAVLPAALAGCLTAIPESSSAAFSSSWESAKCFSRAKNPAVQAEPPDFRYRITQSS